MSIEEKLVQFLLENNLTITTAESCTGGMISSRLVNVNGISGILKECHVTYSPESKIKYLNVSADTINQYNIVSTEVATEMAIGASNLAKSNIAISVTGYAGPSGGTDDIAVGTVCIGCYYNNKVIAKKYCFDGNRLEVRTKATEQALKMAYNFIVNNVNEVA